MYRQARNNGRRHRPRGRLRHYGALLGPAGAVAGRAALERNGGQRASRLLASVRDRVGQSSRPTRPRMRALIAAPGGRLRWRSLPAPPPPGPSEAIVRPIAIATCDMDPVIALGATPFPLPLHIGHECVGEVLSVGSQVSTVRPGERVVVPFQINCGSCAACMTGRTASCTGVPPVSMYGFGLAGGLWGGALADELAVPYADAMLVPLPDGVQPAAAASLADNLVDAYRHVGPHLPQIVERGQEAAVLILGALNAHNPFSASVPIYTALIARALGAERVTIADARPYARAHAERLGLRVIAPDELGAERRAPLVVDVTAARRGLGLAIRAAADDGVCTSSGGLHTSARIPMLLAYAHNVTVHVARTHARALIPEVLELIRAGRLDPTPVTSTIAPLDDAPAVLREHYLAGGVKTVLVS